MKDLSTLLLCCLLWLALLPAATAQLWQTTYLQADSLKQKRLYKESIPLFEQALQQAKQEYGQQSEQYLQTRNGLGRSVTFVKKKEEAEIFLAENVEICRLYGEKTAIYAQALHNAGTFYLPSLKGNNPAKAEEYLKQALALRREILGIKHKDYSSTLNNLAVLYRTMGNYAAGEPLYKESLQIRKEILGTRHPDYAQSLNNLAVLYLDMGKYATAEPLYQESLRIQKEILGTKHPEYAASLNNLANLYSDMGNYALAESLYKESLQINKEVLGTKHAEYAQSLNNLAILYSDMGNYAAAEPLHKESLQIRKEVLGTKHLTYAISLNSLAGLYRTMGNYAAAEPLHKESLQIRKEVLGVKHPEYAQSLNNLANLYIAVGNDAAAEPMLKEALQIRRETLGEKHPLYAGSLNSLGGLYKGKHKYQLADSLASAALHIGKMNPNITHWSYYNVLGTAQTARKRYREAEENLRKGSELIEKIQGKGSLNHIYNQHDLALLYWQTRAYEKAAPLFLEIKENAINLTLKNFPTQSEREKEAFFDNKIRRYVQDFSSFVASTQGRHHLPGFTSLIGEMYNFQLFSKALLLNAAAKWKHNILASTDKRLITKFFEWESMRNRLTALYQKEGANLKLLDSLENQANELEKQLSKISERFNKVSDKKVRTWQEVQAKLQTGEAAIEMVRLQKFGVYKTVTDSSDRKLPAYDLHYLTDTIQYAALVITPESPEPQMILMPNGKEMERQLRIHRNSMRYRVKDEDSYQLFWQPIADYLNHAKINKVYFSPDGLYHQVSINTLQNPLTKQYLFEEINFYQVSNTKDILTEEEAAVNSRYAVLLGNPTFDAHIVPLPATKLEIERIGETLKKNDWDAEIHQGREAHENAIKELFKPRILHIATHSYFEARYQESAEEYARPKDAKQAVKSNPLWRSGLLLSKTGEAETNLREYDRNDDGILTAYEAMNLNLDGTQLVVLSACETGLGEVKYGEGVYGLQRAFEVAGARNVLMSLWRVDDRVTQEIMDAFYAELLKNTSTRDAYLKIQHQLREKYQTPYYWGAFVLVGK